MNAKEIIDSLEAKAKLPEFRVGDTIKVHVKIREGEKERIQIFEGTVIKRRRSGKGGSFTVRKLSYGIGVERIFANQSPSIEKIEVIQRGRVRRARLYYLRGKKGKDSVVENAFVNEAEEATKEPKSSLTPAATAPALKSASVS